MLEYEVWHGKKKNLENSTKTVANSLAVVQGCSMSELDMFVFGTIKCQLCEKFSKLIEPIYKRGIMAKL